ncbi:MAG TPA: acetoacetate decarboxylase family protein [Polyangia bacterium]|jgi:hypothetical protein
MPDRNFFGSRVQNSVKVAEREVKLPVLFYDATAVAASFAVPRAAVARLLPAPLRPMPFVPTLALMSVAAFEHRDASIGPFTELSVAFPCMLAGGGPLAQLKTFGWYVWQRWLSTEDAVAASDTIWGGTQTLAEVTRAEEDHQQVYAVVAEGREVLRLKVATGRHFLRDRRVFRAYTVQGQELLSTPLETAGLVAPLVLPSSAALTLGDHAVGDEIRGMGVHRHGALGAAHYAELQAVLPRADRAYPLVG